MEEHGRPGWYAWVVVVLIPVLVSMGVLVVSLRVSQRTVGQERNARLAAQQAYCAILVLIDDSYRQSKPVPGTPSFALASAVARARKLCPNK